MALLELPSLTLAGNTLVVEKADLSAAEADSLAELPEAPDFLSAPLSMTAATAEPAQDNDGRLSFQAPAFTPSVSPILSMPLVPAAMRLGGHKFNTADGSSMDAFAICYRLNRRSSVQVIPGDPAPVKLPVATMANNMGVTVGMVYRLSRQR